MGQVSIASLAVRLRKEKGWSGALECVGSTPLSFFGAAGLPLVPSVRRRLKERKRRRAAALQNRPPEQFHSATLEQVGVVQQAVVQSGAGLLHLLAVARAHCHAHLPAQV